MVYGKRSGAESLKVLGWAVPTKYQLFRLAAVGAAHPTQLGAFEAKRKTNNAQIQLKGIGFRVKGAGCRR